MRNRLLADILLIVLMSEWWMHIELRMAVKEGWRRRGVCGCYILGLARGHGVGLLVSPRRMWAWVGQEYERWKIYFEYSVG